MKPRLLPVLSFACIAVSPPAIGQASSCPKELRWQDATYAQRTTIMDGKVLRASVERFANLRVAEIVESGERSALISVDAPAGAEPIALTFGASRPVPAAFGEISMVLAPPMAELSFRRMQRPCDVADGSGIAFDARDLPVEIRDALASKSSFHGVLTRQGLEFVYTFTVDADSGGGASSWQGTLRYGPATKAFEPATDVQGWHVYRAGAFVKTIAVGAPMPLSAVLDEMRDRPR
jgi:hypothetical protein